MNFEFFFNWSGVVFDFSLLSSNKKTTLFPFPFHSFTYFMEWISKFVDLWIVDRYFVIWTGVTSTLISLGLTILVLKRLPFLFTLPPDLFIFDDVFPWIGPYNCSAISVGYVVSIQMNSLIIFSLDFLCYIYNFYFLRYIWVLCILSYKWKILHDKVVNLFDKSQLPVTTHCLLWKYYIFPPSHVLQVEFLVHHPSCFKNNEKIDCGDLIIGFCFLLAAFE